MIEAKKSEDNNTIMNQSESQFVKNLNIQLNIAIQEKEAATEMFKLSQMALSNLEDVLEERRKTNSSIYIKQIKEEYSEAIQLMDDKIYTLVKQSEELLIENNKFQKLIKNLENENKLLKEKCETFYKLKEQNEQILIKVQNLEEQNKYLREQNNELEDNLNKHVKEAEQIIKTSEQNFIMRDKNLIIKTALSLETRDKESLNETIKQLEMDKNKLNEHCIELEQITNEMEKTLKQCDSKIKEYNQNQIEYLKSIENEKEINKKLKDRLNELDNEIINKEKRKIESENNLNEQIKIISKEKKSLQNEINALTKNIETVKDEYNKLKTESIDKAIHNDLIETFNFTQQQNDFFKKEYKELVREFELLQKKYTFESKSHKTEVQLLKSQLNSLEFILSESTQHINIMQSETSKHVEELILLRNQVNYYQTLFQNNSLSTIIEKCHTLEKEKKETLAQLTKYVSKYKNQISSWKSECQNILKQFEEKYNELLEENISLRKSNNLFSHKRTEDVFPVIATQYSDKV